MVSFFCLLPILFSAGSLLSTSNLKDVSICPHNIWVICIYWNVSFRTLQICMVAFVNHTSGKLGEKPVLCKLLNLNIHDVSSVHLKPSILYSVPSFPPPPRLPGGSFPSEGCVSAACLQHVCSVSAVREGCRLSPSLCPPRLLPHWSLDWFKSEEAPAKGSACRDSLCPPASMSSGIQGGQGAWWGHHREFKSNR